MAATSKKTVLGAVLGNGFLTGLKFAAFVVSGSGAMLSEAVHSFADTSNQLLLYVGIRRSERPRDVRYPYGYGAERYLFALLSAVGIFVFGCGVSVYHGVRNLIHPHDLSISPVVFAVLGVSLLVEGVVFVVALRSVQAAKGAMPLWTYVRRATDPTAIAVLVEDAVACLGVLIAAGGILLSHATDSPFYDAVASILIGLLLGAVAVWLGLLNRRLILGPAVPQVVVNDAIELVETQPSVRKVERHKTRILGAHSSRLSLEVEFDPVWLGAGLAPRLRTDVPSSAADPAARSTYAASLAASMIDQVAAEIDRIEAMLLARYPQLTDIDIEAD